MKYRLRDEPGEDIDLTRHVATERGVAYFHKPIGSPIGGGGRSTERVAMKAAAPAYKVGGKSFDASGVQIRASGKSFPSSVDGIPLLKVGSGFVQGEDMKSMVDRNKRYKAKQRARRASEVFSEDSTPATAPDPIEALIQKSLPDAAGMKQAADWWAANRLKPEESKALSESLGLDPQFSDKNGNPISVRALRKKATDKTSTPEKRAAAKKELIRRAKAAQDGIAESSALHARLAKRLAEMPKDADLAPIIGETLAAHPKLGPLAHVWDRIRLHGYNFTHGLPWADVARDKAGDVAKGVASVVLAGLLMHLGIFIPGLGGG